MFISSTAAVGAAAANLPFATTENYFLQGLFQTFVSPSISAIALSPAKLLPYIALIIMKTRTFKKSEIPKSWPVRPFVRK